MRAAFLHGWMTPPAVLFFSLRVFPQLRKTWGHVYVILFSSLQEVPDSIAHLHMSTTITHGTEGDKLSFSTAIFTTIYSVQSVQFSHSVMSNSLRPHGPQHARPPCPSPTPRVYSNSCSLSRWCHPTISSSVVPFSSHLQSFPASGFFQWVSSNEHQVAKVLEFQLQHQSFQWTPRTDLL